MKLLDRRRAVIAAELRLAGERERWKRETRGLRARIRRNQVSLTLGAGFSSGLVAGALPWRLFGRLGSVLAAVTSFALRSPFAALLADDLRRPPSAPSGT